MDDIKQRQYYPPSRSGSAGSWAVGAAIVFIILLLVVLLSLGGTPSGDGTGAPADPAGATSSVPATEPAIEPAAPAAPAD